MNQRPLSLAGFFVAALVLAALAQKSLAEETPVPEPGAPEAVPLQSAPKRPPKVELPKISQETSRPEELVKREAPRTFRCERTVSVAGKPQNCDSFQARDAESLRPLYRAVPQALAELDSYQETRARLRTLAYVGTAGLVVFFGSVVVSRFFKNYENVDWQTQKISPGDLRLSRTGIAIRNLGAFTGAGMILGSLGYSYYSLGTNEKRLKHSVEIYNQSNPDRPIEIQWKTEFLF